jgi:DNA polymerase III epsilon subunit-like protein
MATLFFYDCEVDHKELDLANITEICVSENNPRSDRSQTSSSRQVKPYLVGYVKKPECANYDSPYQRPISGTRYTFETVLRKVVSFVTKNTCPGSRAILMGYNVEGWDAPVLEKNYDRFCSPAKVSKAVLSNWKWVDLAKIAHHLGYEMGTTQQQLEVAICAEHLPFNRHRALADVKVVKEIWRRMTETIEGNEIAQRRLDLALAGDNAEENVAAILCEYDPSLIATEEAKEVIRNVKAAERLTRKEIVVLYDLESTGLFKESKKDGVSSHNIAPRIVDFAAKILSPFKGAEYENETFDSLVNPGIEIPEEATRVHRITTRMVQGDPETGIPPAPDMKKVWRDFEAWVRTTHTFRRIMEESLEGEFIEPRIILVGYNNFRYDNPLLTGELLMAGVDLKREMDKSVKESWDALPLMATWYTGSEDGERPEKNTLQHHAQFLDIPIPENAHRALPDVEVLEQVLRRITSPIDTVHLIVECVKERINLSSPGVGLKEIIRDTQRRVARKESELNAIKRSIEEYLERKRVAKEMESEVEHPAKRRKIPRETEPDTQDLLVASQPMSQGYTMF